ncbi:MAG TPA: lysophospholipid acyltransferase family protein [Balneolaceae bacterium]|nr:lysophospholipid acyltransferase family protein [Balneolaceae bacterium]
MSTWSRLLARIIGLNIRIEGPKPTPPFLLVSNHLSYVDILPFWAYLKTTFIAKSEVRGWPAIGWVAQLMGVLFIDRNNKRDLIRVNKRLARNINERQGVTLFPEGTSSKGKKVLPFLSSLLYYPASQKIPVYHAAVAYEVPNNSMHEAWNEICWWGDMEFFPHLWNLLKIPSFSVHIRFGERAIVNSDRKLLAQALRQEVMEIFEPTYKKTKKSGEND